MTLLFPPPTQAPWQQQLKQMITRSDELLAYLQLDPRRLHCDHQPSFPVRVTQAYAQRMVKGDAQDPLLLQVLSQRQEHQPTPGYSLDPLQEQAANPLPGLIHKYAHRVLVIATGSCAIHCRYCFRRHFPYTDQPLSAANLAAIAQYLHQRDDIYELILSGGDPLMLKTTALESLITPLLRAQPNIHTLRIHSRLPIVLPSRIDTPLLTLLGQLNVQVVLVVHSNHAQEIDQEVIDALARARHQGIHLLNQAVLLKQVNDSADCLVQLSRRLFQAHTLPYYLHQLDPVQGSAHFAVEDHQAQQLMAQLQARLPGYLVPKLVREQPNRTSKTLMTYPAPTLEIPE